MVVVNDSCWAHSIPWQANELHGAAATHVSPNRDCGRTEKLKYTKLNRNDFAHELRSKLQSFSSMNGVSIELPLTTADGRMRQIANASHAAMRWRGEIEQIYIYTYPWYAKRFGLKLRRRCGHSHHAPRFYICTTYIHVIA